MSANDASPPEGEALSIDQAVDLIAGPEADRDDQDEDAPVADDPPEWDGEDEEGGEDRSSDAAPHFWAAEDKAAFAELPPHLQETVARYEKNRDAAAARVIQEAAEARNVASAHAAEAGELAGRLAEIVPHVEAAFVDRWGGAEPDWRQVAEAYGPDEAIRLKEEFDQEQAGLQRLGAAKQEAETRAFANYVATEFEKLKAVEPELADPRRGGERRQAVVKFLADNGVPPEQIRHVGAIELAIAYDALKFRLAAAGLARSVKPSAKRPAVVPAAAQPQRSPQHRRAESSRSRFAQKPTIDNAVAAILAKG